MKKSIIMYLYPALLTLFLSLPASAAMITCAQCGMKSDIDSKFTSKITQGDKTLYFCDIGDLLTYLNEKKPQNIRAEVKDYSTGEWLDVHKALYVQDEKKFKSPMSWGIAAFKDRKAATGNGSVMDFDGALKAIQ